MVSVIIMSGEAKLVNVIDGTMLFLCNINVVPLEIGMQVSTKEITREDLKQLMIPETL